MSTPDDRLAALEQRVQALEDELAIHRTLTTYGFSVDVGDADRTASLFTEDMLFDLDGRTDMSGREGIRAMVHSPGHQSLLPDSAHTLGPAVVRLTGPDSAIVTSYSRIYHREGDDFRLFRIGFNRFTMERREGRWQIARRETMLLGSSRATELFKETIKELIPDPPTA